MTEVANVEKVEHELNRLIERRALKASGEQHAIEELWAASASAHREKTTRINRAAWYAYHLDQAERIRRSMTALIQSHEAKAAALLEIVAPGGGGR